MTDALLRGLSADANIDVRHLNTQVSRSLAEKGGQHQLRKSLRAGLQALRLLTLLLSYRPDVVYMPLTNSPSFLGILRDSLFMVPTLMCGRHLMIRLHGGYYFYAHTHGPKRVLVRALLRRVSLAMVQGERLVSVFRGLVPYDRIVVIPNGLDDEPFAQARRRRASLGERAGPPRILFVGLMCQEKGVRDIIAAIPAVPGAEFVFAGEWPSQEDEDEVRRSLHQAGVQDRVTFVGVVTGDAKYDLFVGCDVFLFPTYFVYEGHAVSSVEALAAGLPVVCTDHGALNESLRDGWNGYFVPPSDPTSIAARLNGLLADSDVRRAMGERSRRLYEDRFTLERLIAAWTAAVKRHARVPTHRRVIP